MLFLPAPAMEVMIMGELTSVVATQVRILANYHYFFSWMKLATFPLPAFNIRRGEKDAGLFLKVSPGMAKSATVTI